MIKVKDGQIQSKNLVRVEETTNTRYVWNLSQTLSEVSWTSDHAHLCYLRSKYSKPYLVKDSDAKVDFNSPVVVVAVEVDAEEEAEEPKGLYEPEEL